MFRSFCIAALVLLVAPLSLYADEGVRGTLTAVRSCDPSGYTLSVQTGTSTVTLVYRTSAAASLTTAPQIGQRIFAVTSGTATCDTNLGTSATLVSGRSAVFVAFLENATSTPGTQPAPPSGGAGAGSGSGAGGTNPLTGLAQSLFQQITGQIAPVGGAVLQNALGQGASSVAGGLIYGGRYSTVIPCNGGIFYIPDFVGVPYAGPVTWLAPAPPYEVNLLAPPTPTQCHIGRLNAPLACFVGNTLVGIGPRITFYGSSIPGCVTGLSAPPAPPPEEEPPPEDCRAAICAAANAYIGADTSAGPDNGNLACAWAVNNVISNAGLPRIDGDSVPLMQSVLQSGRGRQISQGEAQCGDLVLLVAGRTSSGKSANHVGICLSPGCARVVSNSSSRARFDWFSGPTFAPSYRSGASTFYQVNCPNSP